jgi:hypothetical protein
MSLLNSGNSSFNEIIVQTGPDTWPDGHPTANAEVYPARGEKDGETTFDSTPVRNLAPQKQVMNAGNYGCALMGEFRHTHYISRFAIHFPRSLKFHRILLSQYLWMDRERQSLAGV